MKHRKLSVNCQQEVIHKYHNGGESFLHHMSGFSSWSLWFTLLHVLKSKTSMVVNIASTGSDVGAQGTLPRKNPVGY